MNRVCVIRGGIVHNIIVLDLADLPTYVYPGLYDLMVPDEYEDRAIGDLYDPLTGVFSKPE
jgi:hypothetical protein